jgi:DnaJ-class molecular chaperone
MEFSDLEQACKIFGLKEKASYAEIKKRHRELLRRHHPDHNKDADEDQIRLINAAYAILEEYCANYRFSFSKKEFFEQNPEARLRAQFAYDPIWGGAQGKNED